MRTQHIFLHLLSFADRIAIRNPTGNDQEVEFHEIEIQLFHEVEIMIMRSNLFMTSKISLG